MKKKVCVKCMDVVKDKDDYVRTSFFTKGNLVHEGYIHKSCNDAMTLQSQKSIDMVNRYASQIFSKFGIEPKEEIVIR